MKDSKGGNMGYIFFSIMLILILVIGILLNTEHIATNLINNKTYTPVLIFKDGERFSIKEFPVTETPQGSLQFLEGAITNMSKEERSKIILKAIIPNEVQKKVKSE
jgi:hypothetical protein